jgi:NAD(P)H-hydrate epimerase
VGDELDAARVDEILEAASLRNALAVGPGLGVATDTRAAVRDLVLRSRGPLVLDADGLNAFAGRIDDLARRGGDLVLTPHPGELARLLGTEVAAVEHDRLAAVRAAAARAAAIVVLKGHQTLIADPGGEVAINTTGNPGMATGGTGDVLTGVVGALLAQAFEPSAAARLGAYLHGLAGDLAALRLGERSLAASDVVEHLPGAFAALAGGQGG